MATKTLAIPPEDHVVIKEDAKVGTATVVGTAKDINVNTYRDATAAIDYDHKMKAVAEIVETIYHKCELGKKEYVV